MEKAQTLTGLFETSPFRSQLGHSQEVWDHLKALDHVIPKPVSDLSTNSTLLML